MKNGLSDLNNYLFESIERLMDDDMSDEEFEKERKRADQVCRTAKAIIDNGRLALDAIKHADEYGNSEDGKMLFFLEGKTCDTAGQKQKKIN